MRLLIVCYAAGLILGSLQLIEWLVSRIARRVLGLKPPKRARIAR